MKPRSLRRACSVLEFPARRAHRRLTRHKNGGLADRAPGGSPMHGLLADEVAEVIAVFDAWSEIGGVPRRKRSGNRHDNLI